MTLRVLIWNSNFITTCWMEIIRPLTELLRKNEEDKNEWMKLWIANPDDAMSMMAKNKRSHTNEIYLIKLICVSASPFKLFPFVFDLCYSFSSLNVRSLSHWLIFKREKRNQSGDSWLFRNSLVCTCGRMCYGNLEFFVSVRQLIIMLAIKPFRYRSTTVCYLIKVKKLITRCDNHTTMTMT